jgi:hypothetical protein
MIGDRLVRHIKTVPPRTLPRLNLFVNFMGRKIDDGSNRASYITPNGYGSRLLVQIIKLADLDSLLLPGDPYDRIGEELLSIVRDLEKPIDVRVGKHTTKSLFIQSKSNCFELMTASRRKDPLNEIPFDRPYDHPDWRDIRPFRICDMGTTDLRFQVYNDVLMYQKQGPTHAIYALDCFALVSKFIAYYKAQSYVPNRDQCILDFVHNDVIVPTLLNDSVAIWLRNIYRQQLLSASPLESHTATMWDAVNIDTLGTDFTGAMVDIQYLRDTLKNQNISNQTAMSSLVLSTQGESFAEYYKTLYSTTTTPNEQPYVWVDCLKNLSWWESILMLASFVPDYPDVISMKRDAIRDVRFWLMSRPWQEIHSSIPYRNMIRSRLEGLYEYLKTQ